MKKISVFILFALFVFSGCKNVYTGGAKIYMQPANSIASESAASITSSDKKESKNNEPKQAEENSAPINAETSEETSNVTSIMSSNVTSIMSSNVTSNVSSTVSNAQTSSTESAAQNASPFLLEAGGLFTPGAYIYFANVKITYDGKLFNIQNNRDDLIRVTCCVISLNSDGTDSKQWVSFSGLDEARYKKDLAQNGWAMKQYTNLVKPGQTLKATLDIFNLGTDYPAPAINADGYYHIVFTVSPQKDEVSFSVSENDPISDVYKYNVK